jgi:hypothetical protein
MQRNILQLAVLLGLAAVAYVRAAVDFGALARFRSDRCVAVRRQDVQLPGSLLVFICIMCTCQCVSREALERWHSA